MEKRWSKAKKRKKVRRTRDEPMEISVSVSSLSTSILSFFYDSKTVSFINFHYFSSFSLHLLILPPPPFPIIRQERLEATILPPHFL